MRELLAKAPWCGRLSHAPRQVARPSVLSVAGVSLVARSVRTTQVREGLPSAPPTSAACAARGGQAMNTVLEIGSGALSLVRRATMRVVGREDDATWQDEDSTADNNAASLINLGSNPSPGTASRLATPFHSASSFQDVDLNSTLGSAGLVAEANIPLAHRSKRYGGSYFSEPF